MDHGSLERRPRAVIFDLDGTLADSLADIAAAMNRTLEAHGFPVHPVAAYRTFVGEGVRKLAERALPPGTEGVRDAFLAAYQADYSEHLLDATRLFPGIPEVLDALQRAQVPVGVLSNKPDVPTRRLVEALCSRWQTTRRMGEDAPFASFETTPLNRRVGGELPFPICPLSDAHYSKAVIYRVKRGITRRRHSPRCCQRTR